MGDLGGLMGWGSALRWGRGPPGLTEKRGHLRRLSVCLARSTHSTRFGSLGRFDSPNASEFRGSFSTHERSHGSCFFDSPPMNAFMGPSPPMKLGAAAGRPFLVGAIALPVSVDAAAARASILAVVDTPPPLGVAEMGVEPPRSPPCIEGGV